MLLNSISKRRFASFSDGLVLLSHSTAYADGANNVAAPLQRNPTREDHHATVIGGVNAEKLISGLAQFGQLFGRDIARPARSMPY
jgi:hypothetical protein